MTTETSYTPGTAENPAQDSYADKAKDAAAKGKKAVTDAAKSTAETVKKNPGTTAAVVAGAAAAIAGAAFGASKLLAKDKPAKAKTASKPAAKSGGSTSTK